MNYYDIKQAKENGIKFCDNCQNQFKPESIEDNICPKCWEKIDKN